MFWKPKPTYSISIANHCNEKWHEMTLLERGRFCDACQTAVIDFSVLSDEEIITHIQKSAGTMVCGRVAETQTNRTLRPDTRPQSMNWLRRIAATSLITYTVFKFNEVMAGSPSTPATHFSADPDTHSHSKATSKDTCSIVISGRLLDFHSGEPVTHIELIIEGTQITTITDRYGRFSFQLPDAFSDKQITITTSVRVQPFLDSTSSFIPAERIVITAQPFAGSVNMFRYPIEKLPDLIVKTKEAKKYVQGGIGYTVVRDPIRVNIENKYGDLNLERIPETPLQRLKKLFHTK